MTDEIKIETRPDAPTHWLVGFGRGRCTRFDNETMAMSAAKAWTADGDRTTVYRAVAEFEPVLKPLERTATPREGVASEQVEQKTSPHAS